MNCPHVAESIANHFEDILSPAARQKHQQHLSQCHECCQQIDALKDVPELLAQWQTQPVPEWDRRAIMHPHKTRKGLVHRQSLWPSVSRWTARWAPLAASMVLAIAVLTQTRLDVSDSGWTLSFGADAAAYHADRQQAETRQWVEAALRAHGETTADSLYQWMTWMEQQRELDAQRMEAGFQQLLDRDFQTVDSVRQLATYVMFQENP